jgi:hypothetical protein
MDLRNNVARSHFMTLMFRELDYYELYASRNLQDKQNMLAADAVTARKSWSLDLL